LKEPSSDYLLSRQILLKINDITKPTLVLGLDGTLISLCNEGEIADRTVSINDEHNNIEKVSFKVRPYPLKFLEVLKRYYEIIIYTSSTVEHASAI